MPNTSRAPPRAHFDAARRRRDFKRHTGELLGRDGLRDASREASHACSHLCLLFSCRAMAISAIKAAHARFDEAMPLPSAPPAMPPTMLHRYAHRAISAARHTCQ